MTWRVSDCYLLVVDASREEGRPSELRTISEAEYPGGVLCACGKELLEGTQYALKLEGVAEDIQVVRPVCLHCGVGLKLPLYAFGSLIV